MKVFISWSGNRSKAVAEALRQWLPDVIQSVRPWLSSEDIEAGVRWSDEVTKELSETRFGIICLTAENQTAPWILFEAGALAKSIERAHVIPYLIGLEPSDVQRGPLAQFQAKQANKTETWGLVQTVNRTLNNSSLPDGQIERTFERWWPDLDKALKHLPELEQNQAPKRLTEDKVDEILELTRQMSRSLSNRSGVESAKIMERLLNTLSPKEERILRLLYALGDEVAHTYDEVGRIWGIDAISVMDIETQAMDKLKDRYPLFFKGIEDTKPF